MLNMAINIDQLIEYVISIELNIQFQFGVFLRGHFGTPIDPAPVLLSGKPCSTSHSGFKPLMSHFVIFAAPGLLFSPKGRQT